MSNLQAHYNFKIDFQNLGQHTRGKWLIHGTKPHKDNQLQSPELPSIESKHGKKESKVNVLNPIIKENVQGHKHPWRCVIAEPELPNYRKHHGIVQNE